MPLEMILEFAMALGAFLIAVVFHEYAHGRVAYALGDPTARDAGRLTLNPLAHIDPIGTVILPLLLAVLRLPIFGYAKPVPINPIYFRHPYQGMMLVALAGPAINLLWAGVGAGLWHLMDLPVVLSAFVRYFVVINILLAVFNLIPVPPLDGSRVLLYLLPERGKRVLLLLEPFGFVIIFLLLYAGVFEHLLLPIVSWMQDLLLGGRFS
ncbi:MAG: site-2 protease family protein [Candidatus Bipolaricaulota bacterium]|nr:site-2 protease family protein [Candidatus Bipolaricaulota bacterium]MDW8031330.1 site-2 protease family protein [Candidatus Bipolaricaulota bacterium]